MAIKSSAESLLKFSVWSLLAGLTCVANPAQANGAPGAANERQANTLEEVVVTAQKRGERLQDVPISITAFTAKAIANNRIENVLDLSGIAPNLVVLPLPAQQSPVFSMRGIEANAAVPGQDKGISVYLDGVYLGANTGSTFDLADISRIEVLKGPQGTLFGRNATGGAISIITQLPKGQFRIKQDFTYGNYDQFRSKTRVDFPAWGPLSASVTYLHNERQGDIRNLGAGTKWDYSAAGLGIRTSPEYLGDENANAVSFVARLQPTANLDLIYRFDNSDADFTDAGLGVTALAGFGSPGAAAATGIILGQPAANAAKLTPISKTAPDAVNNAFTTPGNTKNMGHSLTANYIVNDILSFKNILAYRETSFSDTAEVSGAGGLVVPGPPAAGGGLPFVLYGLDNAYQENQWSNETQLNLKLHKFKLTAGYLYYHQQLSSGGFPNTSPTFIFLIPFNNVIPSTGSQTNRVSSRSDAAFAQAEYSLTDKLTLVGGLRNTWDHKNGSDITGTFSSNESKTTWLAGVNYKPSASTLVYAKASTGFISGGNVNGAAYGPETALSYEAGVKAEFLDSRLRTNLSLFDAKYEGLQFLEAATIGIVVANAGDAKAKGLEFEATLLPVHGLTLNAGVGYTDFKYESLLPGVGTISDYLPENRPKVTTTLSADYETDPMSWGGTMIFHVDAQYKSTSYGVPDASTPAAKEATTFDPQVLLNGRVTLANIRLGSANAQVALWGRNLTDNRDAIYTSDIRLIYEASYQPARTFGVDLSLTY